MVETEMGCGCHPVVWILMVCCADEGGMTPVGK